MSQTARRHLRKLGFLTSDDAECGATSLIVVRDGRRDFNIATLPTLDRIALSLSFTWRDAGQVILDGAGLPAFPRLPNTPGLYRFEFHALEKGGEPAVYIGESVDLARRGSNYRNAKTERSRQRTSRRIHKELVTHLGAGGRIDFAITVDVTLDADGEPMNLRRTSARRLAENAAVLLAQMKGDSHVLNIDADLGGAGAEE